MRFMRFLPLLMTLSILSDLKSEQMDLLEQSVLNASVIQNDILTDSALLAHSTSYMIPRDQKSKGSKDPRKKNQSEIVQIELGAVYLRPYQGGTDFAQTVSISSLISNNVTPFGINKPLDFDFDWGVRASLGYQAENSNQSLSASYLYFSSNADRSFTTGGLNIPPFPPNLIISNFFVVINEPGGNNSIFVSTNSKWHLDFNMLDITFGKKYSRKACMSFEPFIGLKGIALWERQKTTYVQPAATGLAPVPLTVSIIQKNSLKGLGPIAGLNLDWRIIKWLSLTGTIDGAILASKIDTTRTSDNVLPSFIWIGSSDDFKSTPVVEGTLALRGVCCWKNKKYIDLKIGAEYHYIFETMKHTIVNSDASTDLSLMGWFATLGFGF